MKNTTNRGETIKMTKGVEISHRRPNATFKNLEKQLFNVTIN